MSLHVLKTSPKQIEHGDKMSVCVCVFSGKKQPAKIRSGRFKVALCAECFAQFMDPAREMPETVEAIALLDSGCVQ